MTSAENSYKYYTASDEGKYSGVIPEGTAEVNVVNTHKEMYSISVTKTVRGNQGDKTKEFDFVLKLTAGDGIELPTTIEYKKGKESEKIDLTNGEAVFKLAHGEKISFKDLPIGIGYEVTEVMQKMMDIPSAVKMLQALLRQMWMFLL